MPGLLELFFGKRKKDKQFGQDVFYSEMLTPDKDKNTTREVEQNYHRDHHREDDFFNRDSEQ